jgi:hypothetical protein
MENGVVNFFRDGTYFSIKLITLFTTIKKQSLPIPAGIQICQEFFMYSELETNLSILE